MFNSNIKNYGKDTEFAYNPFLDILGTGLVTSEGESWKRRQREDIASVEDGNFGRRGRYRHQSGGQIVRVKLEKIRGTGREIELAEEFRLLTLQVIGEAILSLSPEESRREVDAEFVFADYGGV